MRILFASAHPYFPELVGGAQANTHEIAQALIARNHQVGVLAGLTGTGLRGLKDRVVLKLGSSNVVRSSYGGYPVYRSWCSWEAVPRCIEIFKPDVAVAQSGSVIRVAKALQARQVPTIIYNHDVEFDHGESLSEANDSLFIANSSFTAARYQSEYGVESEVIVPFVDRFRYSVTSSRDEVLFVNPIPKKGAEMALSLAESCPDIPFRFVRSWIMSPSDEQLLRERAARLPNVNLATSTDRMSENYARARILLAPSVWEETWGRVATEAQFSGIPVLATRIGGLPESVGPGGVLIEPGSGLETWRTALRKLWDDAEAYAAASAAALRHSQRKEINPEWQIEQFEKILRKACVRS